MTPNPADLGADLVALWILTTIAAVLLAEHALRTWRPRL